ncbi:hypothetical protein CQR44_0037 [Bifidobacterium asteroides]|uniref:Uncharacterized protein n=1 Tax=Bifidobacterium asteroides TaxID=1684 RepID=A0A2N3RD13_9BIFI|nr:hypothetical protein CQR44_0037 [Bifidobacterium asteroides]
MISTVEVTWSCDSGYHFYLHCLLLLQRPLGYSVCMGDGRRV